MNKKQQLKQQIENAEKVLGDMKKEYEKLEDEIELPTYYQSYGNYLKFVTGHNNGSLDFILQNEKLYAQLKLQHIADVLNDGWIPDWDYIEEEKYRVLYNNNPYRLKWEVSSDIYHNIICVYFKTRESAQKAIEIMGEEMEYLK